MVTCWRVNADIGEIEVERDENPLLRLRCVKHSWIGGTSQLLSKNGMHVVTRLPKQDLNITRKVLVKFESERHPAYLGGNRNDTFSR
jgi:hypothetical protein